MLTESLKQQVAGVVIEICAERMPSLGMLRAPKELLLHARLYAGGSKAGFEQLNSLNLECIPLDRPECEAARWHVPGHSFMAHAARAECAALKSPFVHPCIRMRIASCHKLPQAPRMLARRLHERAPSS